MDKTLISIDFFFTIFLHCCFNGLKEVMEWVRDNPVQVKEIAENGRQFYLEYLSFVQNEEHWHELLWRLSVLLQEQGSDKIKFGTGREVWPPPTVPDTFKRLASGSFEEVDVSEEYSL